MNSTEKEEEVPTIPGIKLLSNSLISNLLPINQHSSLQQCLGAFGLLLPEDLWSDNSNNPPSLARPPLSLCLSCGSYINYLADVSMEPGKWICAICYHPNGGKDYSMSQNTGDDYELHHPYYHCIEREPIFQHLGVVGSERLVVVAMDLRFLLSTSPECSERIFLTQLQDHLDKISQLVPISKDGLLSSVQLMLVLFDESSLRVTRLGEGRLEPLMVDVIPIHQLHQTYRWSQLLKRGIHALSIPRFLDSYEAIAKGLLGLVKTFGGASSSSSPFSAPLAMPSLSMLHFYSFLQQIQLVYAPIIEFKLLLVTCQSLPLFPLLPTDHTSTTSPQDKQRLMSVRSPADSAFVGKCFADRIYCSVDYIFIGNDVILTQELLPFLSATHGGLIVGERLSEEHISLSLLESLSSFILSDVTKISNRFFLQEKIEIRCNENIDLLKSFPGNSGFLTLQERQDSLKEGRQKRKEHQVIDDLLSTYQSSSAKLPSYFAQSVATKGDITPLIQKRFPLHLSVTLNTSPLDNALDSNDNRLRPFDPVLLIRENADMSEEELDERHLMSQFIDVHHLKRSYDDYLAYLHDEKVKHQRSIYRIPLKTFYDKILLQFSDHPDNFFDRSLHFPSNQASSGQFACLFNVLDPSPLTEEGEHQPRPHNVDGTEGSGWNGYWSKLSQLFAPSAPATDKGRKFTGTENGDAMQPLSLEDSLMDANHGIIQIQWKSLYYLPDSAEKVKETKVITLKVPIKPIRPNTNPLLDARLWTSLQMKCLVSHYHHLTRQLRFSGRTDELGNDVIKQHRYDMMRLIDEITQVLSKHWASRGILSKEEILQFVRAIFFLREGPLLDGPSVNIEESNVLRNTFLRSELASETEKALLAPRMWLDLSLLPLSSSTHILSSQNIFEVHPSSMMLLPGTIALVDCGSVLVIRRNILPSSFTLSHTFSEISVLAALRALATQIARCRYPVPRIELITDALTPRDRLVFARLSPDHMYFKDTAQSLNASVIAETLMSDMQQARHLKGDEERVWKDVFSIYKLEDYQALLLSSPYTEQRYFTQYAKLQTAQVLFPMNDSIPLPQSSCYPPPT